MPITACRWHVKIGPVLACRYGRHMPRLTVNAIVRRLLHVAHGIGEHGLVHLAHVVCHSLQHACTSAPPMCTSTSTAPQLAWLVVANGCTWEACTSPPDHTPTLGLQRCSPRHEASRLVPSRR